MTPRLDNPDERQATFAPARIDIVTVLDAIVNALGGPKKVGSRLRPRKQPDKARTWCANCLDAKRRDNFHPTDIEQLFKWAQQAGFHDGKHALDRLLGYHPTPPMTIAEEKEDLMRRIQAGQREMNERTSRIEGLILRLGELSAREKEHER